MLFAAAVIIDKIGTANVLAGPISWNYDSGPWPGAVWHTLLRLKVLPGGAAGDLCGWSRGWLLHLLPCHSGASAVVTWAMRSSGIWQAADRQDFNRRQEAVLAERLRRAQEGRTRVKRLASACMMQRDGQSARRGARARGCVCVCARARKRPSRRRHLPGSAFELMQAKPFTQWCSVCEATGSLERANTKE